ncbi:MAG: hypothetical protein ACJ8DZ_14150 [Allosphingosinicella sp.]
MSTNFSRLPSLSFLSIAMAAIVAMPAAAYTFALDWLDRGVAFLFDVLARPERLMPRFGRLASASPSPAFYAAPPAHFLRHEAGTATRGAHRNL